MAKFFCRGKDCQATGDLVEGGFVVRKGSLARIGIVRSAEITVEPVRRTLRESGVLQAKDGKLIFTQDYLFSSPSAAAMAVMGRSAMDGSSGKTKMGKTLRDSQVGEKEPQPEEILTNSLGMKFAWIPPGTFVMGSPESEPERSDDEKQFGVRLTKGFYLGIHPVTQAQWLAIMGNHPTEITGNDRPVEQVSWDDCQDFLKKLSQKDGKHYRLPTEAEWEYACRAGTTTPFYFKTISTDLANYDGNHTYGDSEEGEYREETTPVGSFPANPWGLFDMHGNVWEGVRTGTALTREATSKTSVSTSKTLKALILAMHVLCVVARGTTIRGTAAAAFRGKGRARPGRSNNVGFRVCFGLDGWETAMVKPPGPIETAKQMTFQEVIEALQQVQPGAQLGKSAQLGGTYYDRAYALVNYQMHEGDPRRYGAMQANGSMMWLYIGKGGKIFCGDKPWD